MKEKLSVRLQELMDRKNLNQTELGKMTGITPSSISDYLNERYKPKQDKIDAIARALQVDPAYLMGYEVDERGGAKNILSAKETAIYQRMAVFVCLIFLLREHLKMTRNRTVRNT